MKALVISDIHAFARTEGGSRPSSVRAGDNGDDSPTVRFLRLLEVGELPAPDLIVCPGDLSNQADQAGLDFAWTFLQRVAQKATLGLLLGDVGNHDLDWRYNETAHDPKGMLLDLRPSFPVLDQRRPPALNLEQLQLEFWAHNFCIVPVDECRFVVLNSSAYHGMGPSNNELKHGRVSAATLTRMKLALDEDVTARRARGLEPYLLNVLVCHHHLEKDGAVDDPDQSHMVGAHALVQMMASAEHGRWMVIHGHRHRARLFQTGGMSGPFVLSAASFAATRDRDYDNTSPNQAYLVELDLRAMVQHDLYPAGRIQTWTWQPGMGWLCDRYGGGGLPPTTGFGFRGSVERWLER